MVTRRALLSRITVGGGVVLVGSIAGCTGRGGSGGGSSVEETSEVAMVNSQFDPRNVHVDAGTTVTWVNEDGTAHTVTNASDNWEKDARVDGGGETTHTFERSGVYDVYCRFHGTADLTGMSMKVGVGDAAIESPLGGGGGGYGGGGYG